MKPTEVLVNEHKVILQVLSCLEIMAGEFQMSGKIDVEPARAATDFIRNFADRIHHAKEEDRLFPAMEKKGFPRNGGPVGVMLIEHDQGRSYVWAMIAAIEETEAGTEGQAQKFSDNARSFLNLLRSHISKEDECLYPMADDAFGEQDQANLLEAFKEAERDVIGLEKPGQYLKIAHDLAQKYGVAPVKIGSEQLLCSSGG